MTVANDSITTGTTGTGVATHLVSGKEYQVVMVANEFGVIDGSNDTYSAYSGVVAAAANKVYMHIFNATGSGKIVKIRKLFIQPSNAVNALTAQTWSIRRTSSVGTTGNTAITIQKHDSANANVPAQITAAHSMSAGATDAFTYFDIAMLTEETLPATGLANFFNVLPVDGDRVQDYTLREGEGLKVVNVTGGSYAWTVLAVFSIE